LSPSSDFVIDEAHHVQTSEYGCNQLGKVIDALLGLECTCLKIILATAYFFRGDRLPIISDNHLSRFYRYHIPFDEYWKSLQHIKTYSYDFVTYKATPFQELETILKQVVSQRSSTALQKGTRCFWANRRRPSCAECDDYARSFWRRRCGNRP